MSIFERLTRVMGSRIKWVSQMSEQKFREEFFEENFGENNQSEYSNKSYKKADFSNESVSQLNIDLELFGLASPVRLEEVTKKRNQILKMYHPDRFNGNREKEQTAKELVQIYNEAYLRIKGKIK